MEIGTTAKGVAIVGGGSASGYGMYSLTSGTGESMEFEKAKTDDPSELLIGSWPDFLFQVTGFGTNESGYGANTFGYAYGRFMLNPDGDSPLWEKREKSAEANAKGNESLSSEFKVLKDNEDKDLQQVCKEIYKKPKSDVNNGLWRDVWSFCSVAEHPPLSVSNDNSKKSGYTGKWALKGQNGDGLFSTYDLANDKDSWKHMFGNILKKDINNKDKKSSISSKFASISSESDLYNACEEAYKSNSTTQESDYGKNVKEYCVLDTSVSLSEYPTTPGS